MPSPAFIKPEPDGVLLSVKVQPRASRNDIDPPRDDELKIRVTAPPVDSAANEAVVKLLAKTFGIPKSRVQLVRGQTSRHKTIRLAGLTPADVLGPLRLD